MTTTLQSIIEEFSEEEQKVILAKGGILADEMIIYADLQTSESTASIMIQAERARHFEAEQDADIRR